MNKIRLSRFICAIEDLVLPRIADSDILCLNAFLSESLILDITPTSLVVSGNTATIKTKLGTVYINLKNQGDKVRFSVETSPDFVFLASTLSEKSDMRSQTDEVKQYLNGLFRSFKDISPLVPVIGKREVPEIYVLFADTLKIHLAYASGSDTFFDRETNQYSKIDPMLHRWCYKSELFIQL